MPFYRSDFPVIVGDFLTVMKFVGLLFFVPCLAALLLLETEVVPVFLVIGALTFLVFRFLEGRVKRSKETEFRHAMVTVTMVWAVTCVLGSVPFVAYLGMPFLDALFESVSAWTTTGFTMIADTSSVPLSLLFWRSFMQWIGGIGLVVAILAGVLRMGGSLYLAEAGDEKIRPNVVNTVRAFWWIYMAYTVAGVALFAAAGMPLFDSVNHSMTAIATGGMSVSNGSIGSYGSAWIETVAIFLMVAGSVSFIAHYHLLRGEVGKFLRDVQLRAMVLTAAVACAMVVPWTSLRDGIFHVVSALTCTGFSTARLDAWPAFPIMVLMTLMVIGGSSGSTAGALKLFRVVVLFKSFYWNLRRLLSPHILLSKRIGNRIFKDDEIRSVLIFIPLYLVFLVAGAGVLVSQGYPIAASLFEVASAQGNVGLSMGIAGPGMSFLGKVTLIINMLVGRLEIWAVLVCLGSLFIRR